MSLTREQLEVAGEVWRTGKPLSAKFEELAPILQCVWDLPGPDDLRSLVDNGLVEKNGEAVDFAREVINAFVLRRNADIVRARQPDKRTVPLAAALQRAFLTKDQSTNFFERATEVLKELDAL